MKATFNVSKYYVVQNQETYQTLFDVDVTMTNIVVQVFDATNQSSIPSTDITASVMQAGINKYLLEFTVNGIESNIDRHYYIQLWNVVNNTMLPIGKLDIIVVVENQYPESGTLRLPNNGGTFTYYTVLPNTTFNARSWNVEVVTMQDNVVVSNINSAPTFISFDVNASVNQSNTDDECIIRITKTLEDALATEQEQTFDFVFYQDINPNWIRTNPKQISFTENGGTIQVEVTANFTVRNWNIQFIGDNRTWATVQRISATNSGMLFKITSGSNIFTTPNTGKVVITADDITHEVQCYQNAHIIPNGRFYVDDTLVYDYVESVNTLFYSSYNMDTATIQAVTNVNWITLSNVTPNNMTISLNNNPNLENRVGLIILKGIDVNDNPISQIIEVTQLAFNPYPICRDTFHEITTTKQSVEYTIKLGNTTIYQGRAYKQPNTNLIRFNINKLVYMYLNSKLPNFFSVDNNQFLNEITDYYKKFNLYVDGVFSRSYYFYNDYSYNFTPTALRATDDNTIILSQPINKNIDRRQVFLYSLFTPVLNDLPTNIIYRDEYHIIQNTLTTTTNQWLILDDKLYQHPNATKLSVNGDTYNVIDSCYKYCLYYVNSLGGWDSYLIGGNNKKTDNLTRYSTIKNFDNTTTDFEQKNYVTIIKPKIVLHTNWLNDDESSRMFNLLESNEVYLHDLDSGEILPVNIVNNSVEYKTFTNSGKHKYNYTIEVEIAQTKIRR